MIHALVQMRVSDFSQFWAGFQSRGYALRQANGSLGSQVFQSVDDPEQVHILFQWESRKHMEAFFADARVRESIVRMGGLLPVSICVLHKAGELEA